MVSDVYPTVSAMAADLILPSAMWAEKEGLRQRRAPYPVLAPAGQGAGRGEIRPVAVHGVLQALHQVEEVWPAELIAKKPEQGQDAVRRAVTPTARSTSSPSDLPKVNATLGRLHQRRVRGLGFYVQKGLFEEYAPVRPRPGHDLAPFDVYHEARGLRWPVVDNKGNRWRFREGYDPYVKKGEGVKVLRLPRRQGEDLSRCPIPAAADAGRRNTTCGCAPAACWSTGTPAR